MITLKNWNKQQPEVVYFVQTDYQGDEFMKKLVGIKLLQSIQTVKFTRL